jgi:hypothetical protein
VKPALLCSLLLSACIAAANYRMYAVTWTCLSPEGCEDAEQLAVIDRARIVNGSKFIDFLSDRDDNFLLATQMVPSDELPPECSWLHGFTLFTTEVEPGRFCRTSGGFELELSIPNRDPATHSRWFVEGREIDP